MKSFPHIVIIVVIGSILIVCEAVPIPSPRYGVFIDNIRTLQDNSNLLLATVAFYDDPSLYDEHNISPVYTNREWNPINWSYATIQVDTGQVTSVAEKEESYIIIDDKEADLTPIPVPVMDPMAGYTLRVNGTIANLFLSKMEVAYSMDFSNYIDTEVVLRELVDALGSSNDAGAGGGFLSYPTICFVSNKLNLAYILFPECVDMRGNCRSYVTRVAIINTMKKKLSTNTVLSLSEESGLRLYWDLFFYDNTMTIAYSVYDDLQIVLLPNDPFAGNSPLYVYFHETGLQTISTGSYYFPFSNILHSVVLKNRGEDDDSHNNNNVSSSNTTIVWVIRHKYTYVEMDNSYWDAIVPYGYEIIEKDMTGTVLRQVVLNPNDIHDVVLQSDPNPTATSSTSTSTKYFVAWGLLLLQTIQRIR